MELSINLIHHSVGHCREHVEAGMGWLQKRFCPCIWYSGWSWHHDTRPGPGQSRAIQGHAGLAASFRARPAVQVWHAYLPHAIHDLVLSNKFCEVQLP